VLGLEFFLFAGSGAALMVYNVVMYDFPFGSGLKIVLGMTSLGFFAAIDLALERQRYLVGEIIRTGNHLRVDKNYFPLSGKLGIFSVACILFILGVVFLIINKDLDWLINVGDTVTVEQAQMTILAELAFVVGIFLAHTINVIRAYTGNLRDFLSFENKILARASMGDLEGFVPVGSNDEFGTMAVYTNDMIQGMRETTDEILRTRDVSILTLASLAETRDNETGAHILRTQRYVRALALHLKQHPAFVAVLGPENNIRLLYKSAPLHDIGKVGIADAILLKPGKLSPQEMEIMKSHAALGAQSLEIAETELGSNSFLHFAREIALSHHEKWDGSGYPGGLSGADIPVSGRLMALADVYDALISKRVYKEAFSHEMARSIIVSGKGSHFDPDVVEAFLAIEVDFIRIAANFSDQAYATDEVPTTPRIKRLAGE
ncbi:MAG TPA: HD domain-containing protein, partial [Rhodospirillales bacterium]|nr:HD domain-containing protein [Rhodospirillales bacterium]